MKSPRPAPAVTDTDPLVPSEEAATLALREAAVLLAPVATWLLRSGVPYGALAAALKPVFVDAARAELERAGTQPTYSALSVLSGVHRKDVRALSEAPREAAPAAHRGVPLASQVYTRWLSAKRYRGRDGLPRALPRSGAGITFESLAREVSVDVHPRTLIDELLRLGLVQSEGELLVPVAASFTPSRQRDELTALFAANAGDHIAAAVHNLTTEAPRYLEQSVFADGLGADSVEHLHELAREAWQQSFENMVTAARRRVERDNDLPANEQQRMRFGIYFYSERQAAAPAKAPAAATARPTRKGKKT
jgi:hypothetical protein